MDGRARGVYMDDDMDDYDDYVESVSQPQVSQNTIPPTAARSVADRSWSTWRPTLEDAHASVV